LWRRLWRELAVLAGLWAVIGVVLALVGVFLPGFAVLVAATGVLLGAGAAAALAERVERHGIRMLLLAGFSLLVFLPLAIAVFGGSGTWLYRDLGALDFAGALPIAVGTGSFTMLLALIRDERSDTERILALRGAMLFAVAGLAAAV